MERQTQHNIPLNFPVSKFWPKALETQEAENSKTRRFASCFIPISYNFLSNLQLFSAPGLHKAHSNLPQSEEDSRVQLGHPPASQELHLTRETCSHLSEFDFP
ncbi:hypothetical protein P7K49_008078 [Saguinus oedipus]|uniref:Uncharacterized protein n=1 Tax=Saguinus oedipus TaxID=9490 RepID=A0ABQ9W087_SAGOE|nr:hypothetical protein P7K49_008078 [Saguinus oedipus]